MNGLEGVEQLNRKLESLGTTTARRAMRSAVNAALTPIVKAARGRINAASASSELKTEARKYIGKRLKKQFGGGARNTEAKAGFAVGMTVKKAAKAQKSKFYRMDNKRKGVGVSAANIHWFVLGTARRRLWTGSARGPKAGHSTGQIVPPFAGVMESAVAISQNAALAAARNKLSQILLKEAQRKR
jgi:hypothetical protein